jgi:hypothetical protein
MIIGGVVYQQRDWLTEVGIKSSKTISNFFPFGTSKDSPSWRLSTSTTTEESGSFEQSIDNKPLWEKIGDNPVASARIFDLPNASNTLVYIEKETGNIYKVKGSEKPERISNVTVPQVFDAYFGLDKSKNLRVIVRFVDNDILQSISLNLNNNNPFSSSSDPSLNVIKKVLPKNIIAFAVSPEIDKVFYIEDLGSRVVAYVTDFDFNKKQIIKVLPFKDWIISWPDKNIVVFQSKASSEVAGSLYFLNLKDSSFKRVGNNILGFTQNTSSDLQNIVYGNSVGQSLDLNLKNLKNNKSFSLKPKTLPEKCLWLKNNLSFICAIPNTLPFAKYPDDWYQGNISFSDSLWIYYTDTTGSHQIYDPLKENYDLDLLPQDQDNLNNFYFIDKKTFKLYKLNGQRIFSED